MDYEEKYNTAIEKLQEALAPGEDGCKISGLTRDSLEHIFPELKVPEGESIRNGIIALLQFGLEDGSAIAPGFNVTKEQALAWIEKQSEKPQGKN